MKQRSMKKIEVIIESDNLVSTLNALKEIPASKIIVTEVLYYDPKKGKKIMRGVEVETDYVKKLKIEVEIDALYPEDLLAAIKAIKEVNNGFGKLTIFSMEETR